VKIFLCVVLPLLAQALFVLVIVLATRGNGSFVGLGTILLGMIGLPLTALANWLYTRRREPQPVTALAAKVFLTTLAFPVPMLIFSVVAS
jgi:hypothetical protein